jgi:outer membrane protein OmpA-like peptidoglycan-associated protein
MIILAQAPTPKCGQDPQHPCPKAQPQPQPKAPPPPQPQAQPQPQPQPKAQPQPQPKQQAQPQPQPQLQQQPKQPAQPQPKQQAQPQPQPQPEPKQQAQPQPQPQLQQQPKQQAQPQPQPTPAPGQQRTPPVLVQPIPQGQPPGQPALNVPPRLPPGQPPASRPPVQPQIGNLQQLQQQRQQRTDAAGRVIIEEPDHRMIVHDGGQAIIRHDEAERFYRFGEGRVERRGNENYAIVARPGGEQIITITDDDGRLVRRVRRDPFGHEYVLIDNGPPRVGPIFLNLPPPVIRIPPEQYIVDFSVAPAPFIYQTLAAPPLVPIERPYTLDEVRYNVALRDRMRRVDVDTINFEFGSWEVVPDQIGRLELIANAVRDIVARNPNEVFLIEGHTDAVGSDEDNLSLSDRRAETVANILSQSFQIPPENLTTQGYGSHYLKIPTPEPNRQNRRVTVRRITPLLAGANS